MIQNEILYDFDIEINEHGGVTIWQSEKKEEEVFI